MKTTNGREISTMNKRQKRAMILNTITCACLIIACFFCFFGSIALNNFICIIFSLIGIIISLLMYWLIEMFIELCQNISDIKSEILKKICK